MRAERTHEFCNLTNTPEIIEVTDLASRRAIAESETKQVRHSARYLARIYIAVVADRAIDEGIVDARDSLVKLR